MNNRKNVFVCILAGVMSCSCLVSAGAESVADGNKLKNGLLLKERDNGQYRLIDYNTNDDNTVNVLDLCRVKSGALKKDEPAKQNVKISCTEPWISNDKSQITVPVQIKGNTIGVSAVSFRVIYNTWYFKLADAYSSANAQVSFSNKNDLVMYSAPGGRNLSNEGYFVYLVFDVSPTVPNAVYDIELYEITSATLGTNGEQRELSREECNTDTELSFEFFRDGEKQVTTPSESVTETEPVTTVTEPVETTVTTTTTTITSPPVTTVTTKATKPQPSEKDEMSFSLNDAELSADGNRLKVPVYVTNNTTGICNLSTVVKFDKNKFALVGVERGAFEGYGYVAGNGDNAVFNTNNNENITAGSGVIAYLVFEVKSSDNQNSYKFELTDIKASKSENWNQINIDKCRKNSDVYEFKFGENPTVTTVPVVTTMTTTTTSMPAEVTTVPAVTDPPAATTVTEPPVQPSEPQHEDADLEQVERDIIDMVNSYRKGKGMPEAAISAGLCKAADQRAQELAVLYDHSRPEGKTLDELFKSNGVDLMAYSYSYNASETSASAVYNDIIGHKATNFDTKSFNKIGMGHYYDPNSQYKDYWVLFIGK